MVLNFDLNQLPPDESNDLDGLSVTLSLFPQDARAEEHKQSQTQVEVDDDEVAIISPVLFAEARAKSRRNNRDTNVHNDGTKVHNNYSASSAKQSVFCLSEQDICNMMKIKNATGPVDESVTSKAPEVCCPICKGNLVEETTTKCGHIFCKECIRAAIVAQKKCPTCRQRVTLRGLMRVYIPTTD